MWKFNNVDCDTVPEGCIGFVYEIEFIDGTKYIGKKLAITNRKLKPLKNMRKNANYRRLVQTNWKKYCGSSEVIKAKQVEPMFKTIICWCKTKKEMSYWENYYLYVNNVLLDDNYLNSNISGKFFKGDISE